MGTRGQSAGRAAPPSRPAAAMKAQDECSASRRCLRHGHLLSGTRNWALLVSLERHEASALQRARGGAASCHWAYSAANCSVWLQAAERPSHAKSGPTGAGQGDCTKAKVK